MAVKGLGREETCIRHHDRPAAARCASCHVPVCSSCVVSTGEGKFCSHECAQKTADYRKRSKKIRTGTGMVSRLVKPVVWIVIIVAALGAINKYALGNNMRVIGPYLNKLPFFGTK